MPERPIPVAVQTKMWVYSYSFAEIVDLNPAACMDVCLLRVLRVVRDLQWANHLSRRGLPSMQCLRRGLHEVTLDATHQQI